MRRLAAACGVLALLASAGAVLPARAASISFFSGPSDPSQTFLYLNQLIQSINGIITPLIPNVTSSINSISLTSGGTGSPATIGLQGGGDTNAGIKISPSGSGNIILFGQGNTGVLQFGNAGGFFAVNGLANAPGIVSGKAPLGMSDHLTGYFLVQDWTGRSHGVPGY